MKYLLFTFLFMSFFTDLFGNPPPKTIGIFTFDVLGLQPWDPDKIKTGITGSEEAVIYMSEKLAQRGYRVIVFGKPPENSPYSKETANPRYVPFNTPLTKKLDIAISWRMPSVGLQLKNMANKVYLWPHDTTN